MRQFLLPVILGIGENMWTEILKALPKDRIDFAKIVQDDRRFSQLLGTLDRRYEGGARLNENHTLRNILRQYDNKTMNLDILQALADTDYPREKLEENMKILLEKIPYQTEQMGERIIEEGLELLDKREEGTLTPVEEERLGNIYQEILDMKLGSPREVNVKGRSTRRKMIASRNTFLKEFGDFILTFKAPQENFEKDIDSFARKIITIGEPPARRRLGQRVGKTLITKFKDGAEFLSYIQKNPTLRLSYQELLREHKPDLSLVGTKTAETGPKAKLEALHARKITFSAENIDSVAEVNTYFDVIGQLPGKKGIFMPTKAKKAGKTARISPSIFLLKNDADNLKSAKSDLKTLNLNPYANKILLSGFTKKTWFTDLFRGIKMDISSKNDAYNAIYEDISGIYERRGSKLNLSDEFNEIDNLSQDPKTRKSQIQRFIEDKGLTEEVDAKATELQETKFSRDTKTLSIKEAKMVEEAWKKISDATTEAYGYLGDEFDLAFGYDEIEEEEYGIGELELKKVGDRVEIKYRDDPEEKLREITATELMAILKREGQAGQQDEMRRIRDYLGRGEDFETYLATLSSDEIRQAVQAPSGSRAYMDKIDPLNSLSYLSNINEQMFGRFEKGGLQAGYIKETLLAIASEEDSSQKAKLIKELNDNMLPLLRAMSEFMFDTVQDRLEEIGRNYLKIAGRNQHEAVLMALKLFKEKNLLTGDAEL